MKNASHQEARAAAPLPWPTILAVVWMVTVDLLTRVALGPGSLSGGITLAGGIACLLCWPALYLGGARGARAIPTPLALFALYALCWVAISPSIRGLQNVSVILTFVLTIGITAGAIRAGNEERVSRWMRVAAAIATVIAVVATATGTTYFGTRTFALAGLVFLALMVPHRFKDPLARLLPFLVVFAIALTLSRVALVLAVAMFGLRALRGRGRAGWIRAGVWAGLSLAVLTWVVLAYEPLRARFFEPGDAGLQLGGFTLNTSGRANLWSITWSSSKQAPWLGQGPGSAESLIASYFPNIEHPHNDYLRILHDYGSIGLLLFTAGLGTLLFQAIKRARRTDATAHWSAVLGMMAVFSAMITDNVLVYPYAMIPLAVIIGVSRGLDGPDDQERSRTARELQSPQLIPNHVEPALRGEPGSRGPEPGSAR